MRFVTLFILVFVSFNVLSQQTDKINFLNEGDRIPDFSIGTIQGDTLTSDQLEGKVTVLTFFATWCPPCVKELPHVQKEIWDKYKSNPSFRLFVIGREHSKEEVEKYANDKGFTFPLVADTERDIFKLFASQNIPRMYIIGRDKKIIKYTTGFNIAGFNQMTKLLEEELESD